MDRLDPFIQVNGNVINLAHVALVDLQRTSSKEPGVTIVLSVPKNGSVANHHYLIHFDVRGDAAEAIREFFSRVPTFTSAPSASKLESLEPMIDPVADDYR